MYSADGGIAMGSVMAITLMPWPRRYVNTAGISSGLYRVVVGPGAQSAVSVVYSGNVGYLRLRLGHKGKVWGDAVWPVVLWHRLQPQRDRPLVVVCSSWRLY